MIEKVLEYGGLIFAAVGILCLFLEAFTTFKRDHNPKLTIAGMVFLAVSVIGYVVTEVILKNADIPAFVTVIWIALLWVYLICNLVSSLLVSRHNRALKRKNKLDVQVAATTADNNSEDNNEHNSDGAEEQQESADHSN